MSGWPSGLRRQTQDDSLPGRSGLIDFWSSIEGVGSNPTSDNYFFHYYYILIIISGRYSQNSCGLIFLFFIILFILARSENYVKFFSSLSTI